MLVLDLPPPISVNRMRRIDWRNQKTYINWRIWAGRLYQESGGDRKHDAIVGPYAVVLTIDPKHSKADLDNTIKAAIDWAVGMKLVQGDGPQYLRELTVRWGETKYGGTLAIIEVP